IVLILISFLIFGKSEIYIVTLEGEPVVSYRGGVDGFEATAADLDLDEELDVTSESAVLYARHLERRHDLLLDMLFEQGSFKKLYSYRHVINGFAVHLTPEQADILVQAPGVKSVDRDWKVRRLTTHTPEFLGLPTGVWPTGGGFDRAGEDIVIGFVDSGIYPHHLSFATNNAEHYGPVSRFRGKCEVDRHTNRDFCNGKIVGAQHFAEAAKAAGAFNPDVDFDSPLDGDGHGSHTAAIAAGNNGIPVRMHGFEFGRASGMAPRARIAVYKALYRLFGGFVADVVAAIDQAVHDGVDILNLSLGPNSPPATTKTTFLNPFDATLLSAVKAGVFVVQAAGNGGPFPKSLVSYSPWITTVAAAVDDRRYKNHLTLGNGKILAGIGLSPSTHGNRSYTLVAANDVLLDSAAKYGPFDCQRPEVLNKNLVQGKILLCGYSFNFVSGTSSVKIVAQTARTLGAAGFVLAVENAYPGTKFDPVPVAVPGIVITDSDKSMELINYYNTSTPRDWTGCVKSFDAVGYIGDGLRPILHKSAPIVALFSARGPNIKDYSFQDADLLKPDILAPGSLIWAAWSLNGTDEPNYLGEGFAMISGTSMAAPHIAGIAALVKQKYPHWSPAAIKSALMTTSTTVDRAELPLRALQYAPGSENLSLVQATPFDYGSGHVNPRAALDPGLVFDSGYEDYLGFLCTTRGIDTNEVRNYTHVPCNYTLGHPSNLNVPSVTISRLVGSQTVTRTVTNVAEEEETYTIQARMGPAVAIEASPAAMTLLPGASGKFTVTLTPRTITGTYSFGEIWLKGSRGHKVRIPVVAMGY
ncbi:hypothetical protein M569_01766, partial [Genlisea aurea]